MAIARVKEVLTIYEEQKQAVLTGSLAKGLPLNCRVYEKLLDMLQETAAQRVPVAVPILTNLHGSIAKHFGP